MRTAKEFRALTVAVGKAGQVMAMVVIYKSVIRKTGSVRDAENILQLVDSNRAFKDVSRETYLVTYLQSIELRLKLIDFRYKAVSPLRDPHGLRKQLIAKRKNAQGGL